MEKNYVKFGPDNASSKIFLSEKAKTVNIFGHPVTSWERDQKERNACINKNREV